MRNDRLAKCFLAAIEMAPTRALWNDPGERLDVFDGGAAAGCTGDASELAGECKNDPVGLLAET